MFLFILLSFALWLFDFVLLNSTRYIDQIIKLQKRCIWIIIYSESTEHTSSLFSELKLLELLK